MERRLCIAEKPAVAQAMVAAIDGEIVGSRKLRFNNCVVEIDTAAPSPLRYVIMAVVGHLTEVEPVDPGLQKQPWSKVDPRQFLTCDLKRTIKGANQHLSALIKEEVKKCDSVVLCTDADREGEHIAMEILTAVAEVRRMVPQYVTPKRNFRSPPVRVYRARFASVDATNIRRALANLTSINVLEAIAVELRREIDLRLGYSITRAQTLVLQDRIRDILKEPRDTREQETKTLSFGPCQTPTLAYIVSRAQKNSNIANRDTYTLILNVPSLKIDFRSALGAIHSHKTARVLLTRLLCAGQIRGVKIEALPPQREQSNQPKPLCTLRLLKDFCALYKYTAKQAATAAEHLYSMKMISYPRTETDTWEGNEQMMKEALSNILTHTDVFPNSLQNAVKEYSMSVDCPRPHNGRNNDKSHPPIHPTGVYEKDLLVSALQDNLYNYIFVHFLASLSKPSIYEKQELRATVVSQNKPLDKINTFSTSIRTLVNGGYTDIIRRGEILSRCGLAVTQTEKINYLGKPHLESSFSLSIRHTSYTPSITEANLIGFMTKHGIGTDSSIPSIIDTVKNRHYVTCKEGLLSPSNVGVLLTQFHASISNATGSSSGEYTYPLKRALVEVQMRFLGNAGLSMIGKRDPYADSQMQDLYGFNYPSLRLNLSEIVRNIKQEAITEANDILHTIYGAQQRNPYTVTDKSVRCGACGCLNACFSKRGNKICFYCQTCRKSIKCDMPDYFSTFRTSSICPNCGYTQVILMPREHQICVGCWDRQSL